MRLLLASKSAARRSMLDAAGVPFGLAEAELEEEQAKAGLWGAGFDALGVAEELAQLKALSAKIRLAKASSALTASTST